ASPVMHNRPCYEVEFSDGTVIVADAEHQWRTTTRAGRAQRVHDERPVTTAEIVQSLRVSGRRGSWTNHAVEVCRPLDFPERALPIAPYTFGCWLGDGTTGTAAFTCAEEEILDQIRLDGYVVTKHPSSRMQYTISNRPEWDNRVAQALKLASQGM